MIFKIPVITTNPLTFILLLLLLNLSFGATNAMAAFREIIYVDINQVETFDHVERVDSFYISENVQVAKLFFDNIGDQSPVALVVFFLNHRHQFESLTEILFSDAETHPTIQNFKNFLQHDVKIFGDYSRTRPSGGTTTLTRFSLLEPAHHVSKKNRYWVTKSIRQFNVIWPDYDVGRAIERYQSNTWHFGFNQYRF